MICPEQGYLSDSARELIKIVRAFNFEQCFGRSTVAVPPVAAVEPAELRSRIRRGSPRITDRRT